MDSKNSIRRDFRVLQAIYFLPTPTRNEIARYTGRSPVSVTDTLNRLIGRGLVERSGKTQSRSGRPSATYRLGERTGYVVGVSLDAAGFRVVAVDAHHRVVKESDRVLSLSADPSSHLDEILRQVSAEIRDLFLSPELKERRALAIGIAPPGMVDTEKGIWLHGLQVSGITHVDLGSTMENLFGVTVVVEDAARCLAYVEAARRPPETSRDLVYLYLGRASARES